MKEIFDDVIFDKYDTTHGYNHEFTGCTFRNCDFSDVKFESAEFVECAFESCNLSMVKFENTVLNQVHFYNCKVLGVDFSKCSKFLFSISFEGCILQYSLFFKNDLKNTVFRKCNLQETSFIESNLTSARFIDCDLNKAVFDRTNLEKVDFTSAFNYTVNPETNRVKKAKFSIPEVLGLLNHLDIVISET